MLVRLRIVSLKTEVRGTYGQKLLKLIATRFHTLRKFNFTFPLTCKIFVKYVLIRDLENLASFLHQLRNIFAFYHYLVDLSTESH